MAYFQEEHASHHVTPHDYDRQYDYYYGQFDAPHVRGEHHRRSLHEALPTHHALAEDHDAHHYESHSGYPSKIHYGEHAASHQGAHQDYGWDHQPIIDPRHQGYFLENGGDESQYLALYGARELFGQLAEMEPRKPRKKRGGARRGRKRTNGM